MYAPTPEDWHEINRARWDERVPIHAAGDFYGLDAFLAGRDALRDFELAEVGDVTGRTLLHLQCHIGLDTLSWARHGAAHVVGLDFSGPAVETARGLARSLELPADRAAFVAADVYDAAQAAPDSSYDIVYTGLGALNWLPDVSRWAEVAASLVAPGGFLYLAEFHPFTDCLDDETGSTVTYDYFSREAWVDDSPGTYADLDAVTVHNRSVEWQHPVGEVVSALAAAGLRIEFLHEHDASLFPRYQVLKRGGDGYYRFPSDRPRIPMMYSIKASRQVRG
ncbi:class I SAM-dependent methyltransferase [[Kitasatospora] papulosa]|uniref:Methyltransferase type 11 n=1 Tax=Streptomyces pratensis (strain ATCC 33331 / IAF-45CD) TaxID=591167 RepID=A0A8D3WLQ3_STRFA|nr:MULTISPECIES: class I SAM-dependent methyltransferase [Streptomyces]MCX4414235.1 class I SAM-dependent methyltransferase [[Kitasatospora] papulosa]MEE1780719.1 class I SAM-dependent methyltransferase [Streptomyces sp. JV181]MYT52185.1 methyltransferase domain-containing protein [Streptomyces sp. SID7815]